TPSKWIRSRVDSNNNAVAHPLQSTGPLAIHPFPTRRSSDLHVGNPEEAVDDRGDLHRVCRQGVAGGDRRAGEQRSERIGHVEAGDRKSTRLNSSHVKISYAVLCSKKKIDYISKLYHE